MSCNYTRSSTQNEYIEPDIVNELKEVIKRKDELKEESQRILQSKNAPLKKRKKKEKLPKKYRNGWI